jgi:hypothetical protein
VTAKSALALAVVAVAVMAGGRVSAACNPTKEFQLGWGGDPTFDLIFPPGADTAVQGSVIGHVWQPGAFATTGDTSVPGNGCVDTYWLYPPSYYGTMTIYGSNGGDLGHPDVPGFCDTAVCPAGALLVMVQTKALDNSNAYYTVGRVSEGITGSPVFNFASSLSDWTLVPIPKPIITASSRLGPDVTVQVILDPPAAAFHAPAAEGLQATGTITGYQLVTFSYVAGGDPGREAALWTNHGAPLPTTAASGSATFPCPSGTNVYLANRPIVDGVPTDYVSASTYITCGNLASPGRPGTRPKPIGNKKDLSQN